MDQIEFPSLSFDGRTALRVEEVAARLNITPQHVLDLIEEGKIRAINVAGHNITPRRFARIPIEEYNRYIRENTI